MVRSPIRRWDLASVASIARPRRIADELVALIDVMPDDVMPDEVIVACAVRS